MALNIKDPRADLLVRALVAETGETITEAVTVAVQERLDRVRGVRGAPDLVAEIREIAVRTAALPDLDDRGADEVLGYDEHGLPT